MFAALFDEFALPSGVKWDRHARCVEQWRDEFDDYLEHLGVRGDARGQLNALFGRLAGRRGRAAPNYRYWFRRLCEHLRIAHTTIAPHYPHFRAYRVRLEREYCVERALRDRESRVLLVDGE